MESTFSLNAPLLPRPLRLRPSFVWKYLLGGLALIALGVALAIGFGWWQLENAKELIEESRVWREGVPAVSTKMSGDVATRKIIFHEYYLDVNYVDDAGAAHHAKLKFDTIGGELDDSQEPVVHYLKDAPDRFALSAAVDVAISRWACIALMALIGVGLLGIGPAFLGLQAWRRLADARRSAAHCEEIAATVTKVAKKMVNGKHARNNFFFSGKMADGRPVTGKAAFPSGEMPLYLDAARQTILVLVPQDDLARAVAPRSDFHPFAFCEDEAKRVREEIARRNGGAV